FAYWRLLHSWVEQTAGRRASDWDGSRLILRLYDISYIEFTGLNAHRIQDHDLPGLTGELFFGLPAPGTWQLADVGFLLRNGAVPPAARSAAVPFAPDAPSRNSSQAALLVHGPGRLEHIGNVWDQEHELRERRRPRLRHPLRILSLAFASRPSGQSGQLA